MAAGAALKAISRGMIAGGSDHVWKFNMVKLKKLQKAHRSMFEVA